MRPHDLCTTTVSSTSGRRHRRTTCGACGLALLVLAALAHPAFANGTDEHDYTAFGAPGVFGIGSAGGCAPDDGHEDGIEGLLGDITRTLPCAGGFQAHVDGAWSSVTVTLADDNFDAPFLALCVIEDHARGDDSDLPIHVFCGDADEESEVVAGCGSTSITSTHQGAGGGAREETVIDAMVGNVHLDLDTLETCFGSQGHAVVLSD